MTEGQTRTCTDCRASLPLAMFSKNRSKPCGLQLICKPCSAARYQINRERIRAQQAEAWKTYSAANRDALREKNRIGRLSSKASAQTYREEYKVRFRPKIEAKNAVWSAILCGRMVQLPCSICGDLKADAHHDDYAKPLDVRWLCRMHHSAWHRDNGEAPNGRAIEARVRAAFTGEAAS